MDSKRKQEAIDSNEKMILRYEDLVANRRENLQAGITEATAFLKQDLFLCEQVLADCLVQRDFLQSLS